MSEARIQCRCHANEKALVAFDFAGSGRKRKVFFAFYPNGEMILDDCEILRFAFGVAISGANANPMIKTFGFTTARFRIYIWTSARADEDCKFIENARRVALRRG